MRLAMPSSSDRRAVTVQDLIWRCFLASITILCGIVGWQLKELVGEIKTLNIQMATVTAIQKNNDLEDQRLQRQIDEVKNEVKDFIAANNVKTR